MITLSIEILPLRCVRHGRAQEVGFGVVAQIVIRPELDGLNRAFEIGAIGDENGLGQRIVGPDDLQQFEAGDAWQVDIGDARDRPLRAPSTRARPRPTRRGARDSRV